MYADQATSSTTSMRGSAGHNSNESPTGAALRGIAGELDTLNEVIRTLEDRLSAVLGPEHPTKDAGQAVGAPHLSPLHGALSTVELRVRAKRDHLLALIDRLTV